MDFHSISFSNFMFTVDSHGVTSVSSWMYTTRSREWNKWK